MTRSKIRTSGAEGLTLSSTDITIASGDLLFGTAAKGVNLGVTSNTDSNTIDDYEEGTFSPSLSDGTNTVSLGTGKYTKIGRHISYYIQAYNVTISSLTATAQLRITGFPFTFQSANPVYADSLFSQREPEVSGLVEGDFSYLLLYKGENNATDYGLFTRNVWGGVSSATFRGQFMANID